MIQEDTLQDYSDQLAEAFLAGVVAVKALDWLGYGQAASRGEHTGFLGMAEKVFVSALAAKAVNILLDAATSGRDATLADYQVQLPGNDWDTASKPWARSYSLQMATEVSLQSTRTIATLTPALINRGQRDKTLADTLQTAYGLDPRSGAAYLNFLGSDKKPTTRTVNDLAQQLLTGRARIIGDVQGLTGINFGRQLTYMVAQANGMLDADAKKVWVTAIDERVCPICRPMDGVAVPINSPFEVVLPDKRRVRGQKRSSTKALVPPVHINCLPGNTAVAATGVTGATARIFDGQMVRVLTGSGYDLSATPNHPVLTRNGWKLAGELVPGDDVVRSVRREWIVGRDHHDDDVPPMIKEVAETLLGNGEMMTAEVPVSPEDFHGDGVGSKIAVVGADGLLPNDSQSALCEHLEELVFAGAGVGNSGLSRSSSQRFLRQRVLSTPSSAVRRSGQSMSFIGRGVGHAGEHGCASIAGSDPGLYESSADHWSADGQALAQRLLALTGEIATDKVVHVEIFPFHGKVFNLDTVPGWYIANGIVTHNCRCTVVTDGVFRQGITTRTARFHDDEKHRGRLASAVEDLIFTKSAEDEPRDNHGRWVTRFRRDRGYGNPNIGHPGHRLIAYDKETKRPVGDMWVQNNTVKLLDVDEDAQGQGVAGALMDHAREILGDDLAYELSPAEPDGYYFLNRYEQSRGWKARRIYLDDTTPEDFEEYEKAFNPLQYRDALGQFAAVGAAAGAGAYVFQNYPKVQPTSQKLPRHLNRIDRKVHRLRSGTYLIPRQYLDFHRRGQSFRFGNEGHIEEMARVMRNSGYQGNYKPVTLHVWDNAVDVADGNHRVEAAYRAKVGHVPTRVIRHKGNKSAVAGVIPAWREYRTAQERKQIAQRYAATRFTNPVHQNRFARQANVKLISQDERRKGWHERQQKIKPLP